MNVTTSTRARGALGIVLDDEILLTAARAKYTEIYGPDAPARLLDTVYSPNVQIAVDRGTVAVVNAEGVGRIAEENDTVEVFFSLGTGAITALPLGLDTIAAAYTGKSIDLADSIRTFGSRLDVNHLEWFDRYDSDYRRDLAGDYH